MLRVNRLAAAIDMNAAGTSAPMTIIEKASPVNQDGNMCWNRLGTTVLVFGLPLVPTSGLILPAMAITPNSAISPRTKL